MNRWRRLRLRLYRAKSNISFEIVRQKWGWEFVLGFDVSYSFDPYLGHKYLAVRFLVFAVFFEWEY